MANKRVIDLPDLSQEVQEGQYVLVDSVGGTGKMDLKHIVDEAGSFDPSGEYPELFAGNLTTDKAQEDKIPYLFRKTGGTLSGIGERCYDTIVGASVGENQLVQSGDTSVTVPNGHKYYSKINGTETLGASTGTAIAINDSAKDMVTDLTQKLGSAIADYVYGLGTSSGIAKLREWGFLRGYQAYNAGSIESVEVTGKKVTGFNQWDEVAEVGYINPATGEATSANDRIRTKNFNPCLPNTAYYVKDPTSSNNVRIFYYDADKNFVSETGWKGNQILTTPSNAYFFKFIMGASYGTSYNHDICINLSSSRNGEYEAYVAQSYDYGNDTLNGIFKLDANNQLYADGDRKTSDGLITRKYSLVDLGTLNYTAGARNTANTGNTFYTSGLSGLAKGGGNLMSAKLVVNPAYNAAWETLALNEVKFGSPTSTTIIVCLDVTGADACKSALNGVYLLYEKATETTETSTPFQSPQVCYPDGTEEFITENGVPVGHETEYPYYLKGLVEELIDVPDVPSANGTYVLKATRSASGVAYNWVTG